jgi:hypothetical protein
MTIIAMPKKNAGGATFFVVLYSIIPPFHHSNASASGYGKQIIYVLNRL